MHRLGIAGTRAAVMRLDAGNAILRHLAKGGRTIEAGRRDGLATAGGSGSAGLQSAHAQCETGQAG
jgi:hypothetical protein